MGGRAGVRVTGSGGVRDAGCRCVAPLWSPRCYGGTWVPAFAGTTDEAVGVRGAGLRGASVGLRIDQGVGSGRDAGQDLLAQPAQAGAGRRRPAGKDTVAMGAALRQC